MSQTTQTPSVPPYVTQAMNSDAGYYGVTFDDHGNPREEEAEKAAQTVVMIRVRLC